MEFKLQALSIYEYGQRRDKAGNPHQEDWIYPAFGEINNEKDRLFILCDGMGGHAAGEVASAAVCEAMSKTINGALEEGAKFTEQLLLDAIAAAYDLLDERDTSEDGQKKMGTTMTFLMFHEGGATIAHMGDSRIYHIRPTDEEYAKIVRQTEDHSLVNDLIKIGELTREEALNHPQKNVITRAMQPKQEHRSKAEIVTFKNIRPGDYFYMCSDGMLEQTSDQNLSWIFNAKVSDEEKQRMLVENSKHNRDNHSAHIIHILEVQPESEIEDDPVPVPNETEVDDDYELVNPEFDESEETPDNTKVNEEGTAEPSDESTKVSVHNEKESTAVEGGAESSATFRGKPGTTHNDRGRNKLVWGIFAGIAVAVLTVAGYLISKHHEDEEVTQPTIQHIHKPVPQKSKGPVGESTSSTDPSTSPASQESPAQGGEQGTIPAKPSAGSADAGTPQPSTSADSSTSTSETGTLVFSRVGNVISGGGSGESTEGAVSSAQNQVQAVGVPSTQH